MADEVKKDEVNYKVAEDFKATVKLFSGKEVVIDLMKTTAQEWRTVFNPELNEEEEREILTKATGLTAEELKNLPMPDYRLVIDAYVRLGTQPLTNPT